MTELIKLSSNNTVSFFRLYAPKLKPLIGLFSDIAGHLFSQANLTKIKNMDRGNYLKILGAMALFSLMIFTATLLGKININLPPSIPL
jgi:hypothetical protein